MRSSDYTVNLTRSAQKEIRSLDEAMRFRVIQAIRSLVSEARPPGCRKLVGAINRWRIRSGDYRVIYAVNDQDRVIEVIAVRHGSKAYE